MEPNITGNNVDITGCRVSDFEIIETKYDKSYEYSISGKATLKFKNINTGNVSVDTYYNTNSFTDRFLYDSQQNERPKEITDMITPQDIKEGTVNQAIADYIQTSHIESYPGKVFNLVENAFSINIPSRMFDYAYNHGSLPLTNKKKVKNIEFNYRKISINSVIVEYEDGTSSVVKLKDPVSNNDVQKVVPDYTLPQIYNDFSSWLDEDYEGTIEMADKIFGFDLETLKGADVQ
jgi:hypothetical protein